MSNLYTFNFNARPLNSLGVWRTFTRTKEGGTYEEAHKKLYDEFQDISINWWTNKPAT